MSKPSEGYTRIHPYISPETKTLMGMIMAKENKLMYEVIEEAIKQYSMAQHRALVYKGESSSDKVAPKTKATIEPKPVKKIKAVLPVLEGEKQCKDCEEVKDLNDYYRSERGINGVESTCKACKNKKKKARKEAREGK